MASRSTRRGFSASELMVVVAILAVLGVVGVEGARLRASRMASAEQSAARGQMRKDAKEAYLREVVSAGAFGFSAEVAGVAPFPVTSAPMPDPPRAPEPVRLLDLVARGSAAGSTSAARPIADLPEHLTWRYGADARRR